MISKLRKVLQLYRSELGVSEEFSALIDEPWYLRQYGRLMPESMSALMHYATYGVSLGCDPSPYFSTDAYLEQHPELRKGGINPLWHFVTRGRSTGSRAVISQYADPTLVGHPLLRQPAKQLVEKLWSGFSEEVLPLLKLKRVSPTERMKERSDALWALARWDAFQKNYSGALAYLSLRRHIDPGVRNSKEQVLLESDCLVRFAAEEQAYECVQEARRSLGKADPDLRLALSNTYVHAQSDLAVKRRLSAINGIFDRAGFSAIKRLDSGRPLALDNLIAAPINFSDPSSSAPKPTVSVLMPVYNAGAYIDTALRGLLAQSWGSLEILVIDDCSTDDTRERVQGMAETDERIKLFSMPRNSGAYAARNYGLSLATGSLITVHDADDWSHPQKIETQVRYLLRHPEAIATITDWARAREDLYFTGTFRAHGALTSENTSSLMFRSSAIDALGQWDLARTSADSEFILRLKALYGDGSVVRLHKGVPLAFALDQESSLTRTPVTHAKTLFYGARREYREAARAWHESVPPEALRLPLKTGQRPFPIPSVMEVERLEGSRRYDMVVMADFNLDGGAFVSTMNYINAALALGQKVAIFHWRRADLDVTLPLKASLRERARAGYFDILAAGEKVEADRVLVGYPVILRYRLDAVPEIRTRQFVILVNQMAARLTDGGDPQYDPRRIQSNVLDLFGVDPLWVPISGLVRRLMEHDKRYPKPHHDIWSPLLDVDRWQRDGDSNPRWRGGDRDKPVVGRHARDHYTKWPSSPQALSQAYCVDKACEVQLLGGADYALNVLGRRPENWRVNAFADSTREFLAGLDFFIHYPHERYIEEFGRAVLEAMGLGIPVILPPVFEETFGDYAHYAAPEEVWPLVEELWRDESAYLKAANHGLAFVRERAHYSVLAERLRRLDIQGDAIS